MLRDGTTTPAVPPPNRAAVSDPTPDRAERRRGLRCSEASQQLAEHGVGALAVRPELDVRTVAELGNAGEQVPGVDGLGQALADDVGGDADGLPQVRRADDVGDKPAGAD